MRVCGIVAEYNPFHSGHLFQLTEARRRTGADAVAVVMSACFTQRGEAACLSPAARAEMALEAGADLVLALPAAWAVREAEAFAEAGVLALSAIGCDCLAFGAETADIERLLSCAEMLERPPEALSAALRQGLDTGLAYPEALSRAVRRCAPERAHLLTEPNNLLGVCYLRAILRHGLAMEPVAIPRGNAHRETAITGPEASASAIRGSLFRGDWAGLSDAMPASALLTLRREALSGRVHRPESLDQALLYRLCTLGEKDWERLPALAEGIEQRLRRAARTARSREELLLTAKTRRYPWARLSRLAAHALLQLTASDLSGLPPAPPLLLLGLRDSARPLLRGLKKSGIVPEDRAGLNRDAAWVRAEERAWDLWALGAGLPSGGFWREKTVFTPAPSPDR
ncbi:MAG: nucleotidyltransferase family protein [Clostridia bacterium]|nr:nucleotidyltransferase family protein [Clostridia bacterium]